MSADPTTELTLGLDATHLALRAIGPWLTELLANNGAADSPQLGVIELAVHELGTNSVDHAGSPDGRLTIRGSVDGSKLTIWLEDHGRAFAAELVETPVEPQVRGYGMMIIEQVCEELEYERVGDTNQWRAVFAL